MHTHMVTDETPQENHLPDHAVALVRQVLHSQIWLHKSTLCKPRTYLPAAILIASTLQWQKDVIYFALQGFRITSGENCSSPVSAVTVNHTNTVFNGHFSDITFRITNTIVYSSPDFSIAGITATLTLSTRPIS